MVSDIQTVLQMVSCVYNQWSQKEMNHRKFYKVLSLCKRPPEVAGLQFPSVPACMANVQGWWYLKSNNSWRTTGYPPVIYNIPQSTYSSISRWRFMHLIEWTWVIESTCHSKCGFHFRTLRKLAFGNASGAYTKYRRVFNSEVQATWLGGTSVVTKLSLLPLSMFTKVVILTKKKESPKILTSLPCPYILGSGGEEEGGRWGWRDSTDKMYSGCRGGLHILSW